MNRRPTSELHRPSRRDFLRAGAMGGVVMSLPMFPAAAATGGQTPRARSVILIFLGGGLSHLDSLDPKPDAPAQIRGPFRAISTSVPGVAIGERLPELSRRMNKLTLVRSASHDCDHHEAAANWMLSGRFGSPFGDHPAMGAVVAHQLGGGAAVPPYFALPGNPRFAWQVGGSSFLGESWESSALGDQPSGTFDRLQSAAPKSVSDNALSDKLRPALAGEFDDDSTQAGYGSTAFGQNCLLARRLVERGARFVTISFCGWDHHANLRGGLGRMLPPFDRGVSALIDDLESRGLLAETLLLVCGEFGRTPRFNRAGGRDHWSPAASLLIAGAGVRAGQVIGSTDSQGAYVTDQPVSPADVAGSVYRALGIDPRKELMAPAGRRQAILGEGRVIPGLFG